MTFLQSLQSWNISFNGQKGWDTKQILFMLSPLPYFVLRMQWDTWDKLAAWWWWDVNEMRGKRDKYLARNASTKTSPLLYLIFSSTTETSGEVVVTKSLPLRSEPQYSSTTELQSETRKSEEVSMIEYLPQISQKPRETSESSDAVIPKPSTLCHIILLFSFSRYHNWY